MAKGHYKPRRKRYCAWCEEDISHRGNVATLCEGCHYTLQHFVFTIIQRLIVRAQKPRRSCADCGKNITLITHYNRQRCDECRERRLHEQWKKDRAKGTVVVGRVCIDCGKLMCQPQGKAFTRKRCTPCNTEFRRKFALERGRELRADPVKYARHKAVLRKNKRRRACLENIQAIRLNDEELSQTERDKRIKQWEFRHRY